MWILEERDVEREMKMIDDEVDIDDVRVDR